LINENKYIDVEHRCWTKLALDRYRHIPGVEEALQRLDAEILQACDQRQETPGSSPLPCAKRSPSSTLGAQEKTGLPSHKRHPSRWASPRALRVVLVPPALLSASAWVTGLEGSLPRRPATCARSHGLARPHRPRRQLRDQPRRHSPATISALSPPAVPLKGKRVVLKPNLVEFHKDKVINTDPRMVGAVIDLCKREGASEIIRRRGAGPLAHVEFLVAESGLGEVLKKHQVRFVDINHDEPAKLPNMGRLTASTSSTSPRLSPRLRFFISLPKLKTHHWAGATLSAEKTCSARSPASCYGWRQETSCTGAASTRASWTSP